MDLGFLVGTSLIPGVLSRRNRFFFSSSTKLSRPSSSIQERKVSTSVFMFVFLAIFLRSPLKFISNASSISLPGLLGTRTLVFLLLRSSLCFTASLRSSRLSLIQVITLADPTWTLGSLAIFLRLPLYLTINSLNALSPGYLDIIFFSSLRSDFSSWISWAFPINSNSSKMNSRVRLPEEFFLL